MFVDRGGCLTSDSEIWSWPITLPETNSSPLKVGHPKRKLVFQPSIFRGKLLVSGRVSFSFCTMGLNDYIIMIVWLYPEKLLLTWILLLQNTMYKAFYGRFPSHDWVVVVTSPLESTFKKSWTRGQKQCHNQIANLETYKKIVWKLGFVNYAH